MKKIKYKEVLDFASSLLKYQKFIKLGAQKFHFLKYMKASFPFSDVVSFIFEASAENCRVPFLEVPEKLSFEKI